MARTSDEDMESEEHVPGTCCEAATRAFAVTVTSVSQRSAKEAHHVCQRQVLNVTVTAKARGPRTTSHIDKAHEAKILGLVPSARRSGEELVDT